MEGAHEGGFLEGVFKKKTPTTPSAPVVLGHGVPTYVRVFQGYLDDTTTFFTDAKKDPGTWSSSIKDAATRTYVVSTLRPLVKLFNNLNIPYVAMLGMTWDLRALRNVLRSAPSTNFASTLKGITLSRVSLGANRRLLLQYLSYLMGKDSHTDMYNAGNLAAMVYITCSANGICTFRISSVLSSGAVVLHPSFNAPPVPLNQPLSNMFDRLLLYFPLMMAAMRESDAIDFVNNTWRFTNLMNAS